MVIVLAIQGADVERHLGVRGQRLKEVAHEFRLKLPHTLARKLHLVHQVRPPRKVERDLGEGLVHRHGGAAEARNPLLRPKRLGQGLAQTNADVFDRVVRVHLGVARRLDRKVEAGVARQEREHVIEEADGRLDLRPAPAVEVEVQGDPGFLRLAPDAGGTFLGGGAHARFSFLHASRAASNRSFSSGVPTVMRSLSASRGPFQYRIRMPRAFRSS